MKDPAIALHVRALCDWIAGGRPLDTRMVVGTMSDVVEGEWSGEGYHATAMRSDKEGHADKILHAKLYDLVLNDAPGTLVLASGDGAARGVSQSSLGTCVAAAIRAGWKVELVCWSQAMARVYLTLLALVPSRFTVRYLDDDHAMLCQRKPV